MDIANKFTFSNTCSKNVNNKWNNSEKILITNYTLYLCLFEVFEMLLFYIEIPLSKLLDDFVEKK